MSVEHNRTVSRNWDVDGPVMPGGDAEIRSELCSIRRAAAALGVGTAVVRRLIQSGDIVTRSVPGRRHPLVVTSSIRRWWLDESNRKAGLMAGAPRATAFVFGRHGVNYAGGVTAPRLATCTQSPGAPHATRSGHQQATLAQLLREVVG